LLVAGSLGAQRPDTLVRVATAPVHAGVAELKRDLAIGIADGDEKYMIGAIDDIAIAANGTFYVLDRSVPAVRVYDAAGKFVKNVGGRGSGPGEYRAAAAVAIAKNGNLVLWDPGNARVNVYTPAGDVVTSWPTLGGSGSASGRGLMTTDSLGRTFVHTRIWKPGGPLPPPRAWIVFDAAGALRDTLFVPDAADLPVLKAQNGPAAATAGVPFAPVDLAKVSPLGYLVTARTSRIAIDLHEPGRIASVRRDVPLQPVTAHERDSARAAVTTSLQKTQPGWSWDGPDVPKTKSPVLGLEVAADGKLWVKLSQGPRIEDPSNPGGPVGTTIGGGRTGGGPGRGPSWSCPSNGWAVYDVYEPSGRYHGQVKIAEKIEPIVMRGDYVWAATCNDEDVPQVVRYRIAWK
jgi:hypothetical protein